MYRIKVDKNDKASLTPAVVMYSKLQICTRAHVEIVSRLDINLLSHEWAFCHTYSLQNVQKWPFSLLEIDLIPLLVSVEKAAFCMHLKRGSCKLDLSTSGCYKT